MTAKAPSTLSSYELSLLEPTPAKSAAALSRAALCPECGQGRLDYNGMLELECPVCGFKSGGGGGCT